MLICVGGRRLFETAPVEAGDRVPRRQRDPDPGGSKEAAQAYGWENQENLCRYCHQEYWGSVQGEAEPWRLEQPRPLERWSHWCSRIAGSRNREPRIWRGVSKAILLIWRNRLSSCWARVCLRMEAEGMPKGLADWIDFLAGSETLWSVCQRVCCYWLWNISGTACRRPSIIEISRFLRLSVFWIRIRLVHRSLFFGRWWIMKKTSLLTVCCIKWIAWLPVPGSFASSWYWLSSGSSNVCHSISKCLSLLRLD